MALNKVDPVLAALRNSAVVLLGAALRELFPSLQLIGGRVTAHGFVYTVSADFPLDAQALPLIEERMRAIVNRGAEVVSREMLATNAAEYFRYRHQQVKADLLEQQGSQLISLLQLGEFLDLAPFPHVQECGQLRAFRLLSVGEKNAKFQITGTIQTDERSLKSFIRRLKESREKGHCHLGRDLDLFSLQAERSHVCLWHPKGELLRRLILDGWKTSMTALGFQPVSTTGFEAGTDPGLRANRAVRHAGLYRTAMRSYRHLPLGYVESSEVYAMENVESQCGLLSLPVHTLPEGTLFCRPDQVLEGLTALVKCIQAMLEGGGFQTKVYLTSGTVPARNQALQWFQEALREGAVNFEPDQDEWAEDGPRVNFRIVDALGCEWLGPSLQINLALPEVLKLYYQGADGMMHRPVMIAVQALGSLERWIGLLLEKTGGALPFGLAPEQVRIIPITQAQCDYAAEVQSSCEKAHLRVTVDTREERLAAKIFACEKAKVPFALILGDQEKRQNQVTVRHLGQGCAGKALTLNDFLASLLYKEGLTLPN